MWRAENISHKHICVENSAAKLNSKGQIWSDVGRSSHGVKDINNKGSSAIISNGDEPKSSFSSLALWQFWHPNPNLDRWIGS